MEKILEATDLCKTFSNGSVQQHVLKNLNINIYKGDFTIIMGSSGSGKSTLLYGLSGMDRPTLGSIKYENEEISKYSNNELALFRRKHCGFVFQHNYLNDSMTVMDNILVTGLLNTKNRKKVYKNACELLEKVGIDENCYDKYPTQLSGGEAQRVAIVRAIINNPDIIFADEPTGALNSSNTINVLNVFSEINKAGQSIVMVTHDIKSALRGNRILYLKDGVIIDELNLEPYDSENNARYEIVSEFLKRMGW